jgi:hypothetical protein
MLFQTFILVAVALTFVWINPTSAGAGVTVRSIMTFASVFYTAGHAGSYVGRLTKLSQMCDWHMAKVKDNFYEELEQLFTKVLCNN